MSANCKKTRLKKAGLLMVLDHPEIPLHNNPAELGARQRVRKRAVSFGPRTPDGAKAWDTFMTLTATAKKLGVSIYRYIHDRVSGAYAMPDLADLISQRARQQPLGTAWAALARADAGEGAVSAGGFGAGRGSQRRAGQPARGNPGSRPPQRGFPAL